MNESVTEEGPITVIGLAQRQSNDHPERIGSQWHTFFARGGPSQIPERLSDDVYAVYFEYEGDQTKPYSLLLGCAVPAGTTVGSGMSWVTIPRARYARFPANGTQPQALVETWKTIWAAPIQRTFRIDFERHRSPTEVEVNVGVR